MSQLQSYFLLLISVCMLYCSSQGQTETPMRPAAEPTPIANDTFMGFEVYDPISTLVVPENPVQRAKYPFIDVHNHQFGMPTQDLDQLTAEMDKLNMQVMVNLSGRGRGDLEHLAGALKNVHEQHPKRFIVFTNINFDGIDEPDWGERTAKQVEDDYGRIDILINHASVQPRSPLLDMDEWDWHRVLDVNLTGTFLMTQSVGRLMRARGGGTIINLIPDHETGAAFTASMRGLEGFTRQAARELSPYGIRVHAVRTGRDRLLESVLELLADEKEEP